MFHLFVTGNDYFVIYQLEWRLYISEKILFHFSFHIAGLHDIRRLFPDSDKPNSYIIGRVAVLKEFRRNSLGSEVIKALESKAAEKNADSISLSAQCRVQKFYESLGYHATDDLHDDEGCPHVTMVKKL